MKVGNILCALKDDTRVALVALDDHGFVQCGFEGLVSDVPTHLWDEELVNTNGSSLHICDDRVITWDAIFSIYYTPSKMH